MNTEPSELKRVAEEAASCRRCPLWKHGTQTVFGEGAESPLVMLIGEQPGDKEDLAGHPFVGPAGRVLNESLAQAGIDPAAIYITNAVKHFKWTPSGNRRLHQKPNRSEIMACRPWLEAEIHLLMPKAIVCLGATAAQSLLGAGFKVTENRRKHIPNDFAPVLAVTVHPSMLLRIPDRERRHQERANFIEDLKWVRNQLDD